MLDHSSAATCFSENRINFSNPETLPENFSLSAGLEDMSPLIEKILSKVESLHIQLVTLRNDLARSR